MNETTSIRQIPGALDVRLLNDVMNHEEAYRALKSGVNINKAHAIILRESSEIKIDYTEQLKRINNQLERLPSKYLRSITKEDKKVLRCILSTVKEHLGEIHERVS